MTPASAKPVLVIGGGIAGLTAAVELAYAGCGVILVEKSASLGGRVARMHHYLPKLCPPACGLEMHFRRLRDRASIEVLTLVEVEQVTNIEDGFEALVRIRPRFVDANCTLCGACAEACLVERTDDFNYGLAKTKAAWLPHPTAYPQRFAMDRALCRPGCDACEKPCAYRAIHLSQAEEVARYNVSAIIAATGWAPYDARRIENLGFGRSANVVTNVQLERMAAADGPTGGRILRPSDGKEPRTVAFVQCAGSRDENHLPYVRPSAAAPPSSTQPTFAPSIRRLRLRFSTSISAPPDAWRSSTRAWSRTPACA